MKNQERIYKLSFPGVYPYYVEKAEKKGRTRAEVDQIICWLTGYSEKDLQDILAGDMNYFYLEAGSEEKIYISNEPLQFIGQSSYNIPEKNTLEEEAELADINGLDELDDEITEVIETE
jgi:hypothetical protein